MTWSVGRNESSIINPSIALPYGLIDDQSFIPGWPFSIKKNAHTYKWHIPTALVSI
jgi:hypothetical protein